jgi:hypothetical protein
MRLAAGINVGPDNVAAWIDPEGPCGDGFWEIDGSEMAISQQEPMELAGAVPVNPDSLTGRVDVPGLSEVAPRHVERPEVAVLQQVAMRLASHHIGVEARDLAGV